MESLPLLALVLLACPVGMGLMMWFMMRGNTQNKQDQGQGAAKTDAEIASLRAELDHLRATQRDADRERS